MEILMSYALTRMALIYLAGMNLLTFCVFGIDKRKAQKGRWRIPERTLFLLAIIGGSLGALVGMQLFRHKTKHKSFVFGIPAILVAQVILGYWLYHRMPL